MKKGFTIVEISIALVALGIVIILVLKGRDVYENARINSDVTKVSKIATAISTYDIRFNNIPGMLDNGTYSPYRLYRDLLGEGLIEKSDFQFGLEPLYASVIGCSKTSEEMKFLETQDTSKQTSLCLILTKSPPTEDIIKRADSSVIACYIEAREDDGDYTFGIGRASNNVAKDNETYFSNCGAATQPVSDYGYIIY